MVFRYGSPELDNGNPSNGTTVTDNQLAWPDWPHPLSLREPWLQARRYEAHLPLQGAPREALRRSLFQALLRRSSLL